ncbi:GNAT family N-acetyltransferase [Rubrobacter aplysinae]|uniref:GNAT family N-acetyltransferase n=1 Tax=Rubrobacter aplysinae TaxID=909625 RepID=UPI00069D7775|nr:GNAT family N-acetyltransferase [Rubrobacter aplysinae]
MDASNQDNHVNHVNHVNKPASDAGGFLLRDADAGDEEAVYRLSRQLAAALGDSEPRQEAVRGRLLELLEEPRAGVLVAEERGRVRGVATLWIKPDLAHGDTVVEVPTLVVDEEARGRGIGRLLMRGVRDVARGYGASLIELVATRDNSAARAFYQALGFSETDHLTLELVGYSGG